VLCKCCCGRLPVAMKSCDIVAGNCELCSHARPRFLFISLNSKCVIGKPCLDHTDRGLNVETSPLTSPMGNSHLTPRITFFSRRNNLKSESSSYWSDLYFLTTISLRPNHSNRVAPSFTANRDADAFIFSASCRKGGAAIPNEPTFARGFRISTCKRFVRTEHSPKSALPHALALWALGRQRQQRRQKFSRR
jgi:hypothetical protein